MLGLLLMKIIFLYPYGVIVHESIIFIREEVHVDIKLVQTFNHTKPPESPAKSPSEYPAPPKFVDKHHS